MTGLKPSGLASALAALLLLQGCADLGKDCAPVNAADYDAFWLWSGVKPQSVLDTAKRLYILESEIRGTPGRWIDQRAATPRIAHAPVFMVIRVETLDWAPETEAHILAAIARWERAGTKVAGLQIDFDARTRALEGYGSFLARLRAHLPRRYALSITGLLDWSANADSLALNGLGQTVDEVVLQTYQGRHTVAGYETYVRRLDRMQIPFRLGIVQNGAWCPAPTIARNPHFRGYVVFLVNPEAS